MNAKPLVSDIIVHSNLTALFEPGREYLPAFLKKHEVGILASLPHYEESEVDIKRGKGVFNKSIEALKTLNCHLTILKTNWTSYKRL